MLKLKWADGCPPSSSLCEMGIFKVAAESPHSFSLNSSHWQLERIAPTSQFVIYFIFIHKLKALAASCFALSKAAAQQQKISPYPIINTWLCLHLLVTVDALWIHYAHMNLRSYVSRCDDILVKQTSIKYEEVFALVSSKCGGDGGRRPKTKKKRLVRRDDELVRINNSTHRVAAASGIRCIWAAQTNMHKSVENLKIFHFWKFTSVYNKFCTEKCLSELQNGSHMSVRKASEAVNQQSAMNSLHLISFELYFSFYIW